VKPAAAIDADQATTIGFLGPAATYSHQAALNVFGSSVNYKPFGSIDDVFKGVEQGECSKAIIPIENSIAGFVLDSLHMMNACEISVVQMMYLPINHCLISQSPLDQIKEVHSKDQALAQCKGWLEEHLPGVTQVGRSSTSQAVELSQRRTEVAAIASSLASQRYKIPIVRFSDACVHGWAAFTLQSRVECLSGSLFLELGSGSRSPLTTVDEPLSFPGAQPMPASNRSLRTSRTTLQM